jgi:hypothetical protein
MKIRDRHARGNERRDDRVILEAMGAGTAGGLEVMGAGITGRLEAPGAIEAGKGK